MARLDGRWIGQNDSLLELTDVPADRVYAAILTSLIGEGAYEVAGSRNRRQADAIVDAVAEYARRLMTGGPWRPDGETGDLRSGSRARSRRPRPGGAAVRRGA